MVNFELSGLIRNVVRCMLFVTYVFSLQFWNFKARNLLQKMSFESPITQILLHRDRYDLR